MKYILQIVLMWAVATGAAAQEVIQLPAPRTDIGVSVVQAMKDRKSSRTFAQTPVSQEDLSLILWAACGINRPDKKLLTTPTAINAQDISVYVCNAKGVYLYEAAPNTLKKVSDSDIRASLATRQEAMKNAPVFLLLVSDYSKFRQNGELYGPMDAGYVSENICLMCAALGLNTVPRAMMDKEAVAAAIPLSEGQKLMLNHPIGHP